MQSRPFDDSRGFFLAAEKEEWAREPWLKGNGSTLIVHQSRLVFRGVGARLQRCWLTARSYTAAPALLRMTGQTLSLSWRRPKAVSLGHCGQQARCYRKSDWICECGGGWLVGCVQALSARCAPLLAIATGFLVASLWVWPQCDLLTNDYGVQTLF